MLFDLQFYYVNSFSFLCWLINSRQRSFYQRFHLNEFSLIVRYFRIENLQESKLFNIFYLAKYFFGTRAYVFFLKKYFVLGKTYYNMEQGFHLSARRLFQPLSLWIFQIQPLVNLSLTRDFVLTHHQLQWVLRDPSIFSERKTNTGLFDLNEPLIFLLNYREPVGSSIFLTKKMLSSLKLLFY